jgi:hypothetical protein
LNASSVFSLQTPTAKVPLAFTVSGTSNSIDYIGNPAADFLTIGLEGQSNSVRLYGGTLHVSGTSNAVLIFPSVTATITGSSNKLTPISGPAYTFVDPSNSILAANGRIVTSTRGDGQTYTAVPGGTLVITEPNYETLWTGVGTPSLAGGKILQHSPTLWAVPQKID